MKCSRWFSWLCWTGREWPVSRNGTFAWDGNPCISSPAVINRVGLSFMRFIVFMKCQSQRMHLTGAHATQTAKGQKAVLLGHFLSALSRHLCVQDLFVCMWLECIIFSTHLSRSQEVKIEGNWLSQGRKTSGNWNKVFFPQSRKPFSEFLDSRGLKDRGVDLRPMPRLPIPIKKSWLTDNTAIGKFLLPGREKNKYNEPKPHTFPICLKNASAMHLISIDVISNPLPSIYNNRLRNCVIELFLTLINRCNCY